MASLERWVTLGGGQAPVGKAAVSTQIVVCRFDVGHAARESCGRGVISVLRYALPLIRASCHSYTNRYHLLPQLQSPPCIAASSFLFSMHSVPG